MLISPFHSILRAKYSCYDLKMHAMPLKLVFFFWDQKKYGWKFSRVFLDPLISEGLSLTTPEESPARFPRDEQVSGRTNSRRGRGLLFLCLNDKTRNYKLLGAIEFSQPLRGCSDFKPDISTKSRESKLSWSIHVGLSREICIDRYLNPIN